MMSVSLHRRFSNRTGSRVLFIFRGNETVGGNPWPAELGSAPATASRLQSLASVPWNRVHSDHRLKSTCCPVSTCHNTCGKLMTIGKLMTSAARSPPVAPQHNTLICVLQAIKSQSLAIKSNPNALSRR